MEDGDFGAAVSQFLRAQETYRLMALPGEDLILLPGLNEQDWGDFMGPVPPEALRPAFDADYERRIDVRPPNGESSLGLYTRAKAALRELASLFSSENLVIVTHGRTLIALRMAIEGVPPTDAGWQFARRRFPELPNCGAVYYSHFGVRGDTFNARRVATVHPPYCAFGDLQWQPLAAFAPDVPQGADMYW